MILKLIYKPSYLLNYIFYIIYIDFLLLGTRPGRKGRKAGLVDAKARFAGCITILGAF